MLQYITGTVTQGAADAYAEAEMATALSGVGNLSFRVREILLEVQNGGAVLTPNGATFEIAVSRRTKAAMPLVSDRDVIAKIRRVSAQLSAVGFASTDLGVIRLTYSEDDDVRVVEDPLFLQVDGTATTQTVTVTCRIGVERVNISAIDRLTLLTQSLAE
jgi:hypothetical protein